MKPWRLLGTSFALVALLGCTPRNQGAASAHSAEGFGRAAGGPETKKWLKLPADSNARVLAVEAGVAGDRIAALLEIPESDCSVLIARGSVSVDDVDLFAFGEDGAVLGSDESSDKTPALLVCPPHPRRVYVAARIAAGHGIVAIGAERVAVKDAERLAAVYGVRNRPGEIARRLSVWPGLDEELEQHRRSLGGKWIDLRRVAVPLDSRSATRVSAGIDPDHCLDVLVLPSDDVAMLDVTALDDGGGIVGRAPGEGRSRTLIVCSPTQAGITVEIRPRAGLGLAVVMLSRSTENTERDLDPQAPRFDLFPLASAEVTQARLPDRPRQPPRRLSNGSLSVGKRVSLALDLPNGCSRLDVVGGAPLRGISGWLWSPKLELVANGSGGAAATLFACTHAGKLRLDLEALNRGGPFTVELSSDPEVPAPLLDQPLAADRLLSRMMARHLLTRASELGAVNKFDVSATKIGTLDIKVPIGRCVDVTAALGQGASGIELRVVSLEGGAELTRMRGSTAVSTEVCALRAGSTLEATLELRALAGEGAALVATRMLDPKH